MHRLIPSRFSDAGTVLADVAEGEAMLQDTILLDGATNDRVQAEHHGLSGIGIHELVYGIPHAPIVNAAFTHMNESGARFNGEARGAWYAADELKTSLAEVTYHKARRLAEMIVPGTPWNRPQEDASTYDDWLADFRSTFHHMTPAKKYSEYLQPEPVPQCYGPSQGLAKQLLDEGSNGLIYPCVRRAKHACLVCFRPALVYNPRPAERLKISFIATHTGYRHEVEFLNL
jgi:hypothetical protein